MSALKLYMMLLGCKPPGRNIEQHDIFFGIAAELRDLVPEIEQFWPGPEKIHIDAWREVNQVDGFEIKIHTRELNKLYFSRIIISLVPNLISMINTVSMWTIYTRSMKCFLLHKRKNIRLNSSLLNPFRMISFTWAILN